MLRIVFWGIGLACVCLNSLSMTYLYHTCNLQVYFIISFLDCILSGLYYEEKTTFWIQCMIDVSELVYYR
jgi:hypothetical protein